MANMSYCRYENTLNALRDCHQAMRREAEEGEALSSTETEAKEALYALCAEIAGEADQLREDWKDAHDNA